jgi:UDP-N-acetyl-D-mannosaminuronic acid dehydrogenase
MECRSTRTKRWNRWSLSIGGHCLPKDTKMFINSSNTIKSKILQAAMEIDEDYKEYIQNREKKGSTGSVTINTDRKTQAAEPSQLLYTKKIK